MEIDNTEKQVTETDKIGRTFTQDEVNKIVSDRLKQDRAKREAAAQPTESDEREKALNAREAKLNIREYLQTEKLDKYADGLMSVLDISDSEAFKGKIEKLREIGILPTAKIIGANPANPPRYGYDDVGDNTAKLREAFGLK